MCSSPGLSRPLLQCLPAARCAAALLLTFLCHQAAAQSPADAWREFQLAREQGPATTVIDLDNDTLLLNGKDSFYTSGVRLTREFSVPNSNPTSQSARTSNGWRIGQELYTASDIKLPPARVLPPDHPYAGWLYGGAFKTTTVTDGSYQRFGLDLGCLGPCAGGRGTQTTLHRIINQPQPQGWSRQVRNELGAVLYADIAPVRWQFGRLVDLTPSVQGRFGNIFTDIGGSLLLRAGQLEAAPNTGSLQTFARAARTG